MSPSSEFLGVYLLSDQARAPLRATSGSAGHDLFSARDVVVPARGTALVPLDISVSLPPFTYGRIAPRSGLAMKRSIDVGAGVIDSDYEGAVGVVLFNHSDSDFQVNVGDRIAQLIIEKISVAPVQVLSRDDDASESLPALGRGGGGFGSTGDR